MSKAKNSLNIRFRYNNSLLRKISFLALILMVCLANFPVSSYAAAEAADVYPHELAYREAKYIALARVVSFDPLKGLLVEFTRMLRGNDESGKRCYLRRTSAFPFMDRPGTKVTLFLKEIEGGQAELWKGPTSGGMIWDDQATVALIARAAEDPERSLRSADRRERFAAAYYLSFLPVSQDLDMIVKALIWGLARGEHEINQAAMDAFASLDIGSHEIIGRYDPGFRLELKKAIAADLSAWWDKKER